MNWTEESIEEFIKTNKDRFIIEPRPTLEATFFDKLRKRFKKVFISIVPHLIWVGAIVVVVWALSFSIWYFFNIPTLWTLVLNLFK